MKNWMNKFLGVALLVEGSAFAFEPLAMPPPPPPPPPARFMSTVQLAVQERNGELLDRSQKLVKEQFATVFTSWPEFEGKPFEMRTNGNEVIFSMVTTEDMQNPMQVAVANIIQQLNGKVHARGRSLFYRTSLSPESELGGYLEVSLDDSHTKIRSISAQSVPLRDLLKEVRFQLGSLSYLIPGECAQRLVDWSFGDEMPVAEPKSIDVLMSDLATLFSLKSEKKNGTYIFTGTCAEEPKRTQRPRRPPTELLRSSLVAPTQDARTPQVYFPLLPIGD